MRRLPPILLLTLLVHDARAEEAGSVHVTREEQRVVIDEPVEVSEWPCGDHGAEVDSYVTVSSDIRGIHASRSTYSCELKWPASAERC
ncbi:MAG TPA: hypothetical protein VMR50_03335 [Myxococcota bacterium]|nr:hypothetical protein [Myxococcota bacterium]